jgi:DivIVA domain-containing protein
VTYPGRVDRDSIERRDFPVGRRGYDQAAVDAHLRRVADELESLRGRAPARGAAGALAAGTSEQVRVILEAAETSAAELRADAGRQAGEQVARVGEAAGGMLARLDELERELGGLLEALRRSGEQLSEGLARLQEQVREAGDAPAAPEAPAPLIDRHEAQVSAAEEPAPPANGDEAGARLIALSMALSGTPREETARYLAEHFSLPDAETLLDDVYERAGR